MDAGPLVLTAPFDKFSTCSALKGYSDTEMCLRLEVLAVKMLKQGSWLLDAISIGHGLVMRFWNSPSLV